MSSETILIRCVAEGKNGEWQGLCLDFDLAVQGESFEEVYRGLIDSVMLYLETVTEYPPAERERLLNRKAPLWLRFKFTAKYLLPYFSMRPSDKEYHSYTTRALCPG